MRPHGRPGQAAVEFGLVVPAFLLIVAGTIQFGQVYFNYARVLQAAQEGARHGAVLPYTRDDAAITARAQQVAPGGTADTVTIAATVSATNSAPVATNSRTRGNLLTVTVRHNQPLMIPFFPVTSLPLSATASMIIEQTP